MVRVHLAQPICECDGIGRRDGLKIRWILYPWEFKSPHSHQYTQWGLLGQSPQYIEVLFLDCLEAKLLLGDVTERAIVIQIIRKLYKRDVHSFNKELIGVC